LSANTTRVWQDQCKASGVESSKLFYQLVLQALDDKATRRNPYIWKRASSSGSASD